MKKILMVASQNGGVGVDAVLKITHLGKNQKGSRLDRKKTAPIDRGSLHNDTEFMKISGLKEVPVLFHSPAGIFRTFAVLNFFKIHEQKGESFSGNERWYRQYYNRIDAS